MRDSEKSLPAGGVPEFRGAELAVAGWHAVRLDATELAALRKATEPLPPGVQAPALKHSDDQTVAAFAALCRAMPWPELAGMDYQSWAIVAASRFIGRVAVVGTIDKFNNEGPWGVSMQVTPHHTVHAISSTLSLALGCHGTCIGAGGGPADEASALLAAVSLLRRPGVGGLWLLFTGWVPEMLIDRTGRPTAETHCVAAALALRPSAVAAAMSPQQSVLRIQRRPPMTPPSAPLDLTRACSAMLLSGRDSLSLRADLEGGLEVQVELQPAPRETGHSVTSSQPTTSQPRAPHFILPAVAAEGNATDIAGTSAHAGGRHA